MNPIPVKFYLALIAAIIISVMATIFSNHYADLKEAAATNEQRGAVLENTSATVVDGTLAEQQSDLVDAAVAAAADAFTTNQTKAKANEPETANRANRAVPASVQRNFSERRRARERYRCAGSECATAGESNAAVER